MHKLNKIEVFKHSVLGIREIIQIPRLDEDDNPVLDKDDNPIIDSGGYLRRTLSPDMTLADDEHQEVKDKAEELWTDEVKSAWTTFQAEQKAKE